MLLTGISVLGWLHLAACLAALPTGAIALLGRKGSALHRRMGRWYVIAMVVASLTALGIFRFDIMPGHRPGPGVFGIFHWETLAALVLLALGFYSASRQREAPWAYMHPAAMLISYYLLIGGLINELFARIAPLRALVTAHGRFNFASPVLGMVQGAAMLLFIAVIFWAVIKVMLQRRRPARVAAPGVYPLRFSGGVMLALIGAGLVAGASLGGRAMSYGFVCGLVAGIFAMTRARPAVASRWGAPSNAQLKVLFGAIGMEFLIFFALGFARAFAHMTLVQVWETSLFIVGAHFFPMRWSHGPVMAWLGVMVFAWLGIAVALHLPPQILVAGDGLIKLAFGITMATPLLRRLPAAEKLAVTIF